MPSSKLFSAPARRTHIVLCLVLVALVGASCATAPTSSGGGASSFCRPDQPCWPTVAEWQRLGSGLKGALLQPASPLQPCRDDSTSDKCISALARLQNPFEIQDQPGGTQSAGWLDAWTAAISSYAVAAENAQDVAAAVDFAREHHLRLVVKGTGHDYLGRSNAPDSLLVWTHLMRDVSVDDTFVPHGCSDSPPTPAVNIEAGARWIEAYQTVTVQHGRYVQGGGCTSVGAAGGFLQGGGFGSWSKKFGTAAANMLEAEVVTADGRLRIANACQNQDLFWALRGGGGGTYGIVTRVTLRTHELPSVFGLVRGRIKARSDAAFEKLLERFLRHYDENLNNEHWGEQVQVRRENALEISMTFEGLSGHEAEVAWQPLRTYVEARPDEFTIALNVIAIPASKVWDTAFLEEHFTGGIHVDDRPDAPNLFWWTANQDEVSTYWYAYQSRWVPQQLFEPANTKKFAAALFAASRHWPVGIHFNKGLAGGSAEAIARTKETSMNPAVYRAAALAIVSASGDGLPGVAGHEPDRSQGEATRRSVSEAMRILHEVTPGAGAYVNEADYFETDWQESFWGTNYARLLQIKEKYDPEGMFLCHHCVGSERLNERP